MADIHFAWWNVENLFDHRTAADRPAALQQTLNRELVGWTAAGLFGAIPFLLANIHFTFTDAVFESVSGFTTTGASILTNIEGLSKGLLLIN